MKRTLLTFLMLLLPLGVQAQTVVPHSKTIEVKNAWTIARDPSVSGAPLYMDLINETGHDDALVAVSSPLARRVLMQQTGYTETGLVQMAQITRIDLPAGHSVLLKPGEIHLLLQDLKTSLQAGMEIPVKLEFASSPSVYVRVPIALPTSEDSPALYSTETDVIR